MAIKCKIVFDNGLVAAEAYVRVDVIAGYKGGFDCTANIYLSQAALEGGFGYLEQVRFTFAPDTSVDAPQIFSQAYAALKSDPRFAEAVDLIEAPHLVSVE